MKESSYGYCAAGLFGSLIGHRSEDQSLLFTSTSNVRSRRSKTILNFRDAKGALTRHSKPCNSGLGHFMCGSFQMATPEQISLGAGATTQSCVVYGCVCVCMCVSVSKTKKIITIIFVCSRFVLTRKAMTGNLPALLHPS